MLLLRYTREDNSTKENVVEWCTAVPMCALLQVYRVIMIINFAKNLPQAMGKLVMGTEKL